MDRDKINNIIKYLLIGIGCVFFLFIILSFFRIGFVFWFYERIFDWVTIRLGLDYYLALFISLSATVLFSSSFPYLAWTLLLGRKQYISSLILIGVTGLMCILVYTIGTNIYFDRKTGEPLKWYADTPNGRFISNSPGFDPKYGIALVQYTRELALKEAQEKALKEKQERERIEKEAREKALKERKERERIEKEAKKKELKEKREREHREIYERENPITTHISLLNAEVTGIYFFEGGYEGIEKNQRRYTNVFLSNETRYVYYELDLKFPTPYSRIDFDIDSVWHTPDNRIIRKKQNNYIESNWDNSNHSQGITEAFVPGKYIVDLFVQNNRVASGSFTVSR
jgi:hypothetical protein